MWPLKFEPLCAVKLELTAKELPAGAEAELNNWVCSVMESSKTKNWGEALVVDVGLYCHHGLCFSWGLVLKQSFVAGILCLPLKLVFLTAWKSFLCLFLSDWSLWTSDLVHQVQRNLAIQELWAQVSVALLLCLLLFCSNFPDRVKL